MWPLFGGAKPVLDRYINMKLLTEPMNWAVIWVAATIWLFAFHVIMQAFTAMQSTGGSASAGAIGQGLAPLTAPATAGPSSTFPDAQIWTDGYEGLFVGDGATYY